MASAGSGDQSNITSSDSGHTARFGGWSPVGGNEAFVAPTLVSGPDEEPVALEDVNGGPEFGNSYIIADAVMLSLSSSLSASNVLGATGSSETRRNSRLF